MTSCQIQQLAQQVFYHSITLSESWHDNDSHQHSACNFKGVHVPTMTPEAEDARNKLISSIRTLERLVLGPKDTLQQMYYRSAETGVVHALFNLKVPHNVPQDGSISYAELAQKLNVNQDRLTHLIRNAIVCSAFLAETPDGEVMHSHLSSIWYQDPVMANGNEVMMDNLPTSAFKIAETFKLNPHDTEDTVHPFSVARGIPLFQWFEQNPEQGRKFGQHMRAQSSKSGDNAVKDGYDWNSLAGKTLVDCGGSFGTVGKAILSQEPSMKVVVQDLPKVIMNAKMMAEKEQFPTNLSFAAHSFLEPQPTQADVYLYRMVFHNWSDAGAKRILRALQPVLQPGTRVILIEYVMPEHGSAPDYAELATRRLDNTMYTLMNGKVRELKEFKAIFQEVEPRLKFDSFKAGQLRATHDPRCHSIMSWVMEDEIPVVATNSVTEEALGDVKQDQEQIVEPSSPASSGSTNTLVHEDTNPVGNKLVTPQQPYAISTIAQPSDKIALVVAVGEISSD